MANDPINKMFRDFFYHRPLSHQLLSPIKKGQGYDLSEVWTGGEGTKDDPYVSTITEFVPVVKTFHTWTEDDGSYHRVPVETNNE